MRSLGPVDGDHRAHACVLLPAIVARLHERLLRLLLHQAVRSFTRLPLEELSRRSGRRDHKGISSSSSSSSPSSASPTTSVKGSIVPVELGMRASAPVRTAPPKTS